METQEYRADLKTLLESGPNPLPAVPPGPRSGHLSAAISVQLCMAGNNPDGLPGNLVWGWEIDHITPVSMGGSDDIPNLQLLCKECHKEKTGRERSIASVHWQNK